MHKLAHDIDLSFLQDKQVQLLCFAQYALYIHLDSEIIISVEAAFKHTVCQARKRTYEHSFPIESARLPRLVAQQIRRYQVKPNGSLLLEFSNGDALVIRADNGPYEAYQIEYKGSRIIVQEQGYYFAPSHDAVS